MIKRMMTAVTALMIFAGVAWFPVQVAHAENLESDAIIEEDNIENNNVEENNIDLGGGFGLRGGFGLGGGLGSGETPSDEIELVLYPLDEQERVYFLQTGGDSSGLPLEMTVWGFYGRFNAVECPVVWRYDEFDNLTPGRFFINGDVIAPEGYVIVGETAVQSPVIVYDPDASPLVMAEKVLFNFPPLTRLIPLGLSREDVETQFCDAIKANTFLIITEHGDQYEAAFSGWDTALINTSAVGVYHPFKLELPPGLGFDGREALYTGVYVMDPDEVYMRFIIEPVDGFFQLFWLKEAAEPELWLSLDGGEWEPADDRCFSFGADGKSLSLNPFFLTAGHTYEFQIRYEDGGVSLDNLLIDYTKGKPTYKPIEGDRTGGDRGESSLPVSDSDDETPTAPHDQPIDKPVATPPSVSNDETPVASPDHPVHETPITSPSNLGNTVPVVQMNNHNGGSPAKPSAVHETVSETIRLNSDIEENTAGTVILLPQITAVPKIESFAVKPAEYLEAATAALPVVRNIIPAGSDNWIWVMAAGVAALIAAGIFFALLRKKAVKRA